MKKLFYSVLLIGAMFVCFSFGNGTYNPMAWDSNSHVFFGLLVFFILSVPILWELLEGKI